MTNHPHLDRLSALLQRFPPQIHPVFQGSLAVGSECVYTPPPRCMLHLVGGAGIRLRFTNSDLDASPERASVLLLPNAGAHRLVSESATAVPLFSAALDLGSPLDNPLVRALPALLQVPLQSHPELKAICQVLWDEGDGQRCAHGLLLARACEVLVIQLLRHAIAHHLVETGLLSGLADPRLARVLAAVHAEPAAAWTLPRMAAVANMSRARFAERFARVLGETPGD